MKNKLLTKHLVAAYFFGAISLGGAGYAAKMLLKEKAQIADIHFRNDKFVESCSGTYVLTLLGFVAAILTAAFCFYGYPKIANKTTNELTKKYLQDVFERFPVMKPYEAVLNNPKKLQQIAAIICNGLSDKEQEEILRIVKISSDMKSAESAILNIVKKHLEDEEHPEHMQNAMSAVAGHTIHAIGTPEKTR